jgi:hypothetical protein
LAVALSKRRLEWIRLQVGDECKFIANMSILLSSLEEVFLERGKDDTDGCTLVRQ